MITTSYPRYPGDEAGQFIEGIARGVVGLGHEVDVVFPHHPLFRREDEAGLRFHPYRYAPTARLELWGYGQSLEADVRVRMLAYLATPLAARALRSSVKQLLGSERYDLVHAHWLVPNAALVAGVVRARRLPFVVSLHGSDVFLAERSRPARALANRALRAAGAVTACSSDLHRRVLNLDVDPDIVRTVPYGVDADLFSPDAGLDGTREALGARRDSMLVFAVGRMAEKKGFAYLVDAATMLEGASVVIAGDGDLRAELEQRATALGAPVSFPGRLDRDGVRRALAAADVVVVPSVVDTAGNVDGLPNVLLEALASGRPVVGAATGGIPDVLQDDVNGLLVPPRDAPALAGAIRRLLSEPATRERLARAARRSAVEDLSWEATARAFDESYAQAAGLRPGVTSEP
jgi:glycosyltransferase involved in cell wall biosynthesis